jgi:hypothetical protein
MISWLIGARRLPCYAEEFHTTTTPLKSTVERPELTPGWPRSCRKLILGLPRCVVSLCSTIESTGSASMMSTSEYRTIAEDCLRHADADERDKPLWLTLAQSWLRLAEHAKTLHSDGALEDSADESAEELATAPH